MRPIHFSSYFLHSSSSIFSFLKIALLGAVLFTSVKNVEATPPTIDVNISPAGVISPFAVSCSGTNATAILLYGKTAPFYSSVGVFMRRPCIGGVAQFDSFDLGTFLTTSGGAYPAWSSYYHVPLKLVIKDTTDLPSYDGSLYQIPYPLVSASNGYNSAILGPNDSTYPTLAVGLVFNFDGTSWVKVVPPPPVPPEPIGDPNNLPVSISPGGDVSRVSINCTPTHDYTLSLVHRDGDVVSYTFGVLDRQYCVNGVISFNGFNMNTLLTTRIDPTWWNYIRMPLEYIIKDTTGLYYSVCDEERCGPINLESDSNGFNRNVYLASSTVWTTVGKGPIFTTDDNLTWKSAKDETPVVSGLSNVLFLPGLEASRLYMQKSVLGVQVEDQLWESNIKADVEDLYLNTDGTSEKSGIYTRDAIKETNTPTALGFVGQNIYKSLFNTLDALTSHDLPKEQRMAKWEAYAYDWRQSVDDIVENGTQYEAGKKSLVTTLENLVASSTTGKVTIVAHSNGGLLAKALLVKLQKMKDLGTSNLLDNIDTLILVASPQIGTAMAVPTILHGYDQRMMMGLIMDEEHARELGRNMLGGYGLLPSKEYINRIDVSPVTFTGSGLPNVVTTPYINTYGRTIDSYAEYKNFLFGNEGRIDPAPSSTKLPIKLSSSLFSKAETLHDSIDAWTPPQSMRVVEIAGWGLDTVASFEYYPKYSQSCVGTGLFSCYVLDQRPVFTVDGDKTVVSPSAHFMEGEKWWVNLPAHNREIRRLRRNREHKDMLEVDQLNTLIKSIINKNQIISDLVVTQTKPTDTSNHLRISIHSPVSIGSYDIDGNFTGKVCVDTEDLCYIQQDIPNSSYLEFGEGKYINIPEESLQKVVLQGTDTGTFTFESNKVLPSGESVVSVFRDIPVTTQTQGEVVLNTITQLPEIKLDVTGDGTVDFTLSPQDDFDPILFLEIMKTTIGSFDIKVVRKATLSKRIDGIIKLIQKGKISKAKLKADNFQTALEKKISKPLPKKPKPQRLNNTDAEILISMLEKLLDNLEK
ncbi:MAG: lipase/acyltransferase domain-containing protein [Minisyncoccota bacterium]